jgi:hypothetical protein
MKKRGKKAKKAKKNIFKWLFIIFLFLALTLVAVKIFTGKAFFTGHTEFVFGDKTVTVYPNGSVVTTTKELCDAGKVFFTGKCQYVLHSGDFFNISCSSPISFKNSWGQSNFYVATISSVSRNIGSERKTGYGDIIQMVIFDISYTTGQLSNGYSYFGEFYSNTSDTASAKINYGLRDVLDVLIQGTFSSNSKDNIKKYNVTITTPSSCGTQYPGARAVSPTPTPAPAPSCGKSGITCAKDSQCCSGLVCLNKKCSACSSAGQQTIYSNCADCCSKNCKPPVNIFFWRVPGKCK